METGETRTYHLRLTTDEASDDAFFTIAATTPVAAAVEVFVQLYDTWPEVVELGRRQIAGYPLTTVTLTPAGSGPAVSIEVEDRGLGD